MSISPSNINLNTSSTSINHLTTSPQKPPFIWTSERTTKVALYTIAVLAGIAGIGLIATSVAGIIFWPISFVAIPLFIGSYLAAKHAWNIQDYKNPAALDGIKKEATLLSVMQVVKKTWLE